MESIDYNKIGDSNSAAAIKQFGVRFLTTLEDVLSQLVENGISPDCLSARERAIISSTILTVMQKDEERFRDYVINTIEV